MLKVEANGPVVSITLDRPEVRNALNADLIRAIHEAFKNLPEATRVVILAGNGPAFCAGGDLTWMREAANYSIEENRRDALLIAQMFHAVATCQAVVIAKIHGPAYGGGLGLTAAADVAIASETARFSFSEVRLGLVPATISTIVLPKIGASAARSLFTTGEAFSAERALRIGLIHDLVPAGDLDAATAKVVAGVLKSGPKAVAAAKKLASGPLLSLEDAANLLATVRAGDEAKEGFAAFLEKRSASYVVEP